MEHEDQAILNKALIKKIENSINDIASLGLDTKDFKEELNRIITESEVKVNVSNSAASMGKMMVEMDYYNANKELEKLYSIIKHYDVYFTAYNSCKHFESLIANNNISNEELEKIAKSMSAIIKLIRNSDTIKYSYEEKVVSKIYNVAYELVKLEIVRFGKSSIYDNSINYDIDLNFFSDCVLKDIEKINLNDSKYDNLRKEIYRIKSKGIGQSYFDEKLIKMILLTMNKDEIVTMFYNSYEELREQLMKYSKELGSKTKEFSEFFDKYNKDYNNSYIPSKKEYKKRLLSFLLSLSIHIGFLTGGGFVCKKIATGNKIERHEITYSQEYGKEETTQDIKNSKNASYYKHDIVEIYEYGNWENGEREYKVYDLSNYDLNDISKYLDINLDNFDYVRKYERPNSTNAKPDREAYKEVLIIHDEIGEKVIAVGLFLFLLALLSFFYFIFFLMLPQKGLIDKIIYLLETLKKYKETGKLTEEEFEKLKLLYNELVQKINENEELKNKINELLNNNEFMLELSKIKEDSFNDIDNTIEKAKVLVRKYEQNSQNKTLH